MRKILYMFISILGFSLLLTSCSKTASETTICYTSPEISDETFKKMDSMSSNIIYANIVDYYGDLDTITFNLENVEYIKGEDLNISKLSVNYNRSISFNEFHNGDLFGVDFSYYYVIESGYKVYFYIDNSNGSLSLIHHRNAMCLSNDDANACQKKYIIKD